MTALHDSDENPHGIDPTRVERLRKLVDARDSNAWDIARDTLEAIPVYQPGRHDDGALEWLADEIGWLDRGKSVATLAEYRSAAAHWSAEEVARWPGLTPTLARRINHFPPADRERFLSKCIASNRHRLVSSPIFKELLAEAKPSSGLAQRRTAKPLEATPEVIGTMLSDMHDVITYATEIRDLLATAPLDTGKLEDRADLLDGTWSDVHKKIMRLDEGGN